MAPFKSKAHMRRLLHLVDLGQITKASFEKLLKETPDVDELPERVTEEKISTVKKAKEAKVVK